VIREQSDPSPTDQVNAVGEQHADARPCTFGATDWLERRIAQAVAMSSRTTKVSVDAECLGGPFPGDRLMS